jgi:phosphatidylserine/phosphatidylglycerophosphate/cardiolipin synthase-like enzyme
VTFTTLSNFVITFFVKTLASEQLLAAVKFTPAPEVIENVERKKVEIKLRPHEYDGEHVAQFFDSALVTQNDSTSGGLLVVRIDGRDTSSEFALAGTELTATQRISLVGAAGGAYEVIYTIKKRYGAVTEQLSSPTALWPNLKQLERQNLGFVMPQTKNFTAMPETVETDPDVRDFSPRLTELLIEGDCDISQRDFSQPTSSNHVEILIDGLDTFRRYYEILMLAEHSISILGWEINFSFGLVLANEAAQPLPAHYDPANGKWITLEDVLVSKAKEGVKVRMIVWRHELLSYINRYLYLGEVTIEAEVAKLEKRCKRIGLTIKVVHSAGSSGMSPIPEADIVVVIAGNPKGLISTHHEKLVLVDHECPRHTVAFTGGFDIARGRFDQQAHLVPLPYNPMDIKNITGVLSGKVDQIRKKEREIAPGLVREKRYTGRRIQPMFPAIRLLWHDIQLLLHGPVTRLLHLHFEHRWIYAFTQNPNSAKNLKVHVKPFPKPGEDKCRKHRPLKLKGQHSNCSVRLERTWKGVIDTYASLLFVFALLF